jgi:hypothetical protein
VISKRVAYLGTPPVPGCPQPISLHAFDGRQTVHLVRAPRPTPEDGYVSHARVRRPAREKAEKN